MSVPFVETYRSNAAEAPFMRRWFMRALVLSLAAHLVLVVVFRHTRLERFAPAGERLVPRAFMVNRLEIDPKLLETDEAQPPTQQIPEDLPKVTLPSEKESFEQSMGEVHLTPSAPELAKPILSEKPRAEVSNLPAMAKLQQSTAQEIEKDLASFRDKLIKDAPKSPRQPLVSSADLARTAAGSRTGGQGLPGSAVMPGYSNLDELLSESGGALTGKVAPIFMPGGALFDYDKYDVKSQAIDTLRKLARLIQRNPRAVFSIEGHTDSFGTPEYNQWLSEARAQAVAGELQTLGVDPSHMRTRGFGSSRMIAPANGTIEEQAPNRRVEIVITTPQ
jgi:outer membrane protein OmpA-like peptidoglycan-associated protein